MTLKDAPPSYSAAGDAQDAGDQPEPRTLSFILRFIELLLTGLAAGLSLWLLLKDLVVPPAGGTSAIQAAIFIFCAALLGIVSAVWGLAALCYKFDLLEALSPKSMKFGRVHYLPIYMGVLYLIIGSVGSWYAIRQVQGQSQCAANLSAYRGCSVLVASISMNCCGLAATVVCAAKEHMRIRQWKSVIDRCEITYGASRGGV